MPGKTPRKSAGRRIRLSGEISPQTGEPRGVKSTGQPRSLLWILFRITIRSVTAPGRQTDNRRVLNEQSIARHVAAFTAYSAAFMGEEYGESRPFLFTDFHGDLAAPFVKVAQRFADHAGKMFRTRMRQRPFNAQNLTGSNSTVKRVKRGWRLPANYCFCARSISCRCCPLPVRAQERYCKPRPVYCR